MICAGITYNAGNDRIEIQYNAADGTRGASFTDPYRYIDIYDTDVANGWGFFSKLGNKLFKPSKPIYIFGSATYFYHGSEVFQLPDIGGGTLVFYVYNGANFKTGYDSINDLAPMIIGDDDYSNIVQFYSSGELILDDFIISGVTRVQIANSTATINRLIVAQVAFFSNFSNITLNDVLFTGSRSGWNPYSQATANRMKIIGKSIGLLIYGYSIDFTNVQLINCINDLYLYPGFGETNAVDNFTDCLVDFTKRQILTSKVGTMTLNNKSTFNINITNGDGGTASIYDKNDNLVASQVLSGTWSPVITFEELYEETDGSSLVADTLTTYEPFKLVVSKTGYADLEIPDITITAGEQTDIFGQMEYLPLEVSSLSFTNCSNEASSDGTITVAATGGSGNYNYSKDGGTNWQASGSFTGLALGNYSVKIKDTTTSEEINAGTITLSSPKNYYGDSIDGSIVEETLNGSIIEETINGTINY